MELWHIQLSPVCGRARFALEVKNLQYSTIEHVPGVTDLKLSRIAPKVMVPTLVDGNQVIQGSDEIIAHIEDKVPQPNLHGEDQTERAAIQRYVGVFAETMPQLRTDIVVRIRKQIDTYSKETMVGKMPGFMRVPITRWSLDKFAKKWNCQEGDIVNIRDKITTTLRQLAPQLKPERYLVGDRLTNADIAIAELGLIFRPPADRWLQVGRHTRSVNHADWIPSELTHPFEVWRDWLYSKHRKPR